MTGQDLNVIHADDSLLVVDKPSGVLSIPDGYDPKLPYMGRLLEPSYGRLWVVHRLDKDTSGVMVFARNADAHSDLNAQFANHRVSKIYHILVKGTPEWGHKVVDRPLRTNVGRRNRTAVDLTQGKPALTRFQVLARYPGHTLLEARPETGRTHQIRAHLYDLGFAILSDPLYGSSETSSLIPRLALHARSITLWHPRSGRMESFEAPYPPDFEHTLSQLHQLLKK